MPSPLRVFCCIGEGVPEHYCSEVRVFGLRQQRILTGNRININSLQSTETLAEAAAVGYDYYWLACMPNQGRDALNLAAAFSQTIADKPCRFKANIIQEDGAHTIFPVQAQLQEALEQHGQNFQCSHFPSFETEDPSVLLGQSYITDINRYLNDQQWRETLKDANLYG